MRFDVKYWMVIFLTLYWSLDGLGQIYDNWNNYQAPPGISKIDPFKARGTSTRAIEYNSLKIKQERDSVLQIRAIEDWVHKKREEGLPGWSCVDMTLNYITNSSYLGEIILRNGMPIYNGNIDLNKQALIRDKGSLATYGSLAIPSLVLGLYDKTTVPDGHEMIISFSGDSINDDSMSLTEPQFGEVVQPGQRYVPMNCQEVFISYPYVGPSWNNPNEHEYHILMIAYGTIINGKLEILELNPNLKGILVETRQQSNGIEEQITSKHHLTVYPNPFTDQITITDPAPSQRTIQLMDITGRVLYRTVKMSGNLTITDPVLGTLSAGTYILQVGDQKQMVMKTQ